MLRSLDMSAWSSCMAPANDAGGRPSAEEEAADAAAGAPNPLFAEESLKPLTARQHRATIACRAPTPALQRAPAPGLGSLGAGSLCLAPGGGPGGCTARPGVAGASLGTHSDF